MKNQSSLPQRAAWCCAIAGMAGLLFYLGAAQPATAQPAPTAAPGSPATNAAAAAESAWETLPDGSEGRVTEFHGADGLPIAAYIRKPAGPGPFPIIVWMHGGRDSKDATLGLGRSQKTPVENLVQAGFAIYAADFRHSEKIAIVPIEFDDTVEAVKAARALPFVDAKRVGYMGHSHGAQVGARVVSRVDLSGAVLCAPAAMDLVEVNKAFQSGQKLVPILKKMIGDMEKQYGASAEELAKDPAKYGYRSGITEAPEVRCPLLVISGRDDDNVPASMIDLYLGRLRAAGKQVEAYQPDHGPHGFYFGRPEIPETQVAAQRAVNFFKRQFGAAPAKPQAQYIYKTLGERKLTLDMDYPPDWKPTDQRPAIVFFFGGGWTKGGPTQFKAQAEYFAQRGLVCARADYRLRLKDHIQIDQCVADAFSAMRWVRSHAAQLGIDPNRIVASGGSAGGHLAACTFFADGISSATEDQAVSPKPDAMLLYNPVLNLVALRGGKDTAPLVAAMNDATLKQLSPFFHATKAAPPTLFIDGTKDRFNPEIREFVQKSMDLGAPVEACFTEGQPHGFFNQPPWLAKTTEEADAFLRRIGYLGETPKAPLPSKGGRPDAGPAGN